MAQEDELPVQKKKSKLKYILIFLLLLLIGGGGAAYFFGWADKILHMAGIKKSDTEESQQDQQPKSAAPAAGKISTFALPSFVVNLFDPLGRRYIKLDLELELVSQETIKEIQTLNARIRDTMIMLLSSKTFNELSTQEGKRILQNEILDRLNQILGGPKVVRVFFTDLVIQ